jgi:GT2 family glycosyltransferase/glycosyltransferase involved in cell wall biosynthesis
MTDGAPDRQLHGLLALAADFATGERFADALRCADRARRLDPENPLLAELCAWLLLRLGRAAEALQVLDQASASREAAPTLTRAKILVALDDRAGAVRAINDLLLCFAADTLPELPDLAEALCRGGAPAARGWVGLSSNGEIVGALDRDLARFRRPMAPAERRQLARHLPPSVIGARALDVAPSWRLEGRVRRRLGELAGSVTFGWAPQAKVTVVVTDAAGNERRIQTAPRPAPSRAIRQVFSLPLDTLDCRLAREPLCVEALTPDGERLPLDGSPLLPKGEQQARSHPCGTGFSPPALPPLDAREAPDGRLSPVSIVVPAYAGVDETIACVRSILATTARDEAEVIVVDDASPDPALRSALEDLAGGALITLLVNPINVGFPGSVNRGTALRPDRDVVLVNADAEVFGDWLTRLRRAAYAAEDIATATPFSNNGSLMAYPANGAEVESPDAADLDDRLAQLNGGLTVELPSGSGFCLYIKRACLAQVGPFEETAFGRGYGEEDDFCQRARAQGWRHVGAADVFVRHVGGRSFGPLRSLLTGHNLKRLFHRHPAYRRAIRRFLTSDPLRPLRRDLDESRLAAAPSPKTLLLTVARGGGVERHVARRAEVLQAEGSGVIELRAAKASGAAGACRLVVPGAPHQDLEYQLPDEFDRLAAVLSAAQVRRVEIHHLLGLDPVVLDLPSRLGVGYDLYVHDYSWICPRITLTAGRRYCGEPGLEACEQCVATHGAETEETISVAALRARSAGLLEGAARVIAPTRDVATRLARHFPRIEVTVSPWEPEPQVPAARPRRTRDAGARIRVAVVGAIGEHKGYDRLLACARDARDRDLPLEFVVIGYTEDDAALFETGRAFVTGRYAQHECAGLMEREACDVALLPSLWPETWCYALTTLIACGLPLVAFDIGAMAERLRRVERARLLPLTASAAELNDALLACAASPDPAITLRSRGQAFDFDAEVWARLPGESGWIEGFRVGVGGVRSSAILAGGERTAWTLADWCADPGGARPLVGFALALEGDLARTHRCVYDGVFSSGATAMGADGAPCQSPLPNDPLVAIRLTLSRAETHSGPKLATLLSEAAA